MWIKVYPTCINNFNTEFRSKNFRVIFLVHNLKLIVGNASTLTAYFMSLLYLTTYSFVKVYEALLITM